MTTDYMGRTTRLRRRKKPKNDAGLGNERIYFNNQQYPHLQNEFSVLRSINETSIVADACRTREKHS